MYKINGEYTGIIKNGLIINGECMFPYKKRDIKVDEVQLMKLTKGQENGWFKLHKCDPSNPFEVSKVETKVEKVETKVEAPIEKVAVETPVEEVSKVETKVEKVETPVEEVKPKKKKAASKKKAE